MSEDRDLRAGEFVLGTLSADERAAFRRELESDAELQAAVRAWEARLFPLLEGLPAIEPGPGVWSAIEGRLPSAALTADTPSSRGREPVGRPSSPDESVVRRLRRSRAIWRSTAAAMGALAAGLVAFIVIDAPRLPGPGEQYVAVVNRGGELPALIVRVDPRAGLVHVRSLAAEAPSERSLELWYIGPGQNPRSIGVIDDPARRFAIPAAARGSALAGSTIAVTVEPRGGSPTGGPTGPVVYSGKLVAEQP